MKTIRRKGSNNVPGFWRSKVWDTGRNTTPSTNEHNHILRYSVSRSKVVCKLRQALEDGKTYRF